MFYTSHYSAVCNGIFDHVITATDCKHIRIHVHIYIHTYVHIHMYPPCISACMGSRVSFFMDWYNSSIVLIAQDVFTLKPLNTMHWTQGTAQCGVQGLYSLNGRTSYREISRSHEVARLGVNMRVSFRNLTDVSAAVLLRRLSNFRTINVHKTYIS